MNCSCCLGNSGNDEITEIAFETNEGRRMERKFCQVCLAVIVSKATNGSVEIAIARRIVQ